MHPWENTVASRNHRISFILFVAIALSLTGCGSPPPLYAPHYPGPTPEYYHVRRGDTLYSIGQRFGVDYHKIARWNGIHDPSNLELGQRIRLKPPDSGDGGSRVASGAGEASSSRHDGSSGGPDVPVEHTPKAKKVAMKGGGDLLGGAQGPSRWHWPVSGPIIRDFAPRGRSRNNGIDIAAPKGAKVLAAAAGKVVYSGNGLRGYGNLVIIRHGGGFLTTYAYNEENLVKEDEDVKAGEPVALVGRTGAAKRFSLHFEVRRRTKPVNPLEVLPDR